MGLWVRRFQQGGRSVRFVHMRNFYQAQCEDGYIVAHYQSPRQILCMHKKLLQGDAHCCN
jgi:beta-1,3-galactosyltransferase